MSLVTYQKLHLKLNTTNDYFMMSGSTSGRSVMNISVRREVIKSRNFQEIIGRWDSWSTSRAWRSFRSPISDCRLHAQLIRDTSSKLLRHRCAFPDDRMAYEFKVNANARVGISSSSIGPRGIRTSIWGQPRVFPLPTPAYAAQICRKVR